MECTTGVRTAPTGAGWIWATLADSASSYHIPSLAPAVALPAPRHDRRRTGAAGSPPGGFPFVEFRCADVKCAAALGEPRSVSVFIGGASRFSPPFVPAKAGTQRWPGFPLEFTLAQAGAGMNGALCATEQIYTRPLGLCWTVGTRFATGRSPCGASRGGHFGRIAQLVEQLTLNQRVPGSSPGAPTNH